MSKEIYISSTPHETRLAIVEDEALTEIYYERENEYTLAGSIYNGRVTRVLPGMQSSFVDIGLERDAFLYITDFMEEAPDPEEFDTASTGDRAPRPNGGERHEEGRGSDRGGVGVVAIGIEIAAPTATQTGRQAPRSQRGNPVSTGPPERRMLPCRLTQMKSPRSVKALQGPTADAAGADVADADADEARRATFPETTPHRQTPRLSSHLKPSLMSR
jgi:ribonuclease G